MKDELKLLSQFKEVLNGYQPKEEARSQLNDMLLALVHAPPSTGRSTIIKELLKTDKYYFIVSDTTRSPHKKEEAMEQDGVDYNFKSEEEFLEGLKAGNYLEAEIIKDRQVSGIGLAEIRKAKDSGKVPITDVDFQGVENIVKVKPDTTAVYVLPPNFDSWMDRLTGKAELDQEDIRRRLFAAEQALEAAIKKPYYHFVINDDLESTVAEIRSIIEDGQVDEAQREKGEKSAWDFLGQLKHQLST